MNKKQKDLLQALESSLGIVSTACENAKISRQAHYNWLANDEEYKREVAKIENLALDLAESKLYEKIKEGDTKSILFYLRTKGHKRGYLEKREIQAEIAPVHQFGEDMKAFLRGLYSD